MSGFLDTLTTQEVISAEYVGYFNRAPDPEGFGYWSLQLQAALAAGVSLDTEATLIANQFVPQTETLNIYPFLGLTGPLSPTNPTDVAGVEALVTGIYANLFDRDVSGQVTTTTGAGYWVQQLLHNTLSVGDVVIAIINGATGADQTVLSNKLEVAAYFEAQAGAAGLTQTPPTQVLLEEAHAVVKYVDATTESVNEAEAAINAFVGLGNLGTVFTGPGNTLTLTVGQDTLTGYGYDTFNALLSGPYGDQPTLTNGDSLTEISPATGAVLNATFDGSASAGSLNIRGIATWNIDQTSYGSYHDSYYSDAIYLSGDGPAGPNIISGLTTLNFNDDSTWGSLYIGDNSEPVQEPNGANGFTITVTNAVGVGGYDGLGAVDVDIAAQAFTGTDTIHVTANIVGGFYESYGSYEVPVPIVVYGDDYDDYDPNWLGYGEQSFIISAGASAGPNGPIGFQTWDISSIGAAAVGSMNILALGGEGSQTATTINLTDDGSNTMLFASQYISDSTLADWTNVTTIDLTGTSGFVTITGAEATNQIDYYGSDYAFGGLLTDDTTALNEILGGTGNSFYDLTSLTAATANAAIVFQGGTGTDGNSEIAFNNSVIASVTTANPLGLTVPIANIQILDDASDHQGGTINMADFGPLTSATSPVPVTGLQPLNTPYALLAQGSPNDASDYTTGGPVPPGLPFTVLPTGIDSSTPIATDLENGVVPAGFDLLQFLNSEGSTATTLTSDLTIVNGPVQFAINAQDMADGFGTSTEEIQVVGSGFDTPDGSYGYAYVYLADPNEYVSPHYLVYATGVEDLSGYNITIVGESVVPTVNTGDTLIYFASDDGVYFPIYNYDNSNDGIAGYINMSDVPVFTVENYTTVDIVLPYESSGFHFYGEAGSNDPYIKETNYVILGSGSETASGVINYFYDAPVVSVPVLGGVSASVNFYDNTADNGGSPPGGPDGLVLGLTNFTFDLSWAWIGFTTVTIDATAPTAINDFGAGTFEIGATNANELNAQSTSHLTMDLPATLDYVLTDGFGAGADGITVNGSLTGQNLLQGTSGSVFIDIFGVHGDRDVAIGTTDFQGVGANQLTGAPYSPGVVHGYEVNFGGVGATLETLLPGDVGNDVLTGGVAATVYHGANVENGVAFAENGGVWGLTFTSTGGWITPTNGPDNEYAWYVGNNGDNYFPAGGNDIVNISHIASADGLGDDVPYSTVWFAFYDVSNSGDFGVNPFGVGYTYGQAVTDIYDGYEYGVDGYGNYETAPDGILTINGFVLGDTSTTGDILNFNVNDWATGYLDFYTSGTSYVDHGLVDTSGISLAAIGFHNADATVFNVGVASEYTTIGLFHGTSVGTPADAQLVLDSIGLYDNAAQLVKALTTLTQGDINLTGSTGQEELTNGSMEHLLVAYETHSGNMNIADVTLANYTGSTIGFDALGNSFLNTAVGGATVTAVDIISLVGVDISNVNPHNIHFV